MNIRIEFDTDNAAFEDDFESALGYIMAQAKRKVLAQREREEALCQHPEAADKLYDVNGNVIGWVRLQ